MPTEERWCVVTGGRGFAARHLVEMLLRHNMFSVRIADLGPSIQLASYEKNGVLGAALNSGRALYVTTDLRDKSQVVKALQGVEVVFHMAAPNSSINDYKLHYSVNVEGTKNVIDACVELKVRRLIYTSSPSVVSDGVTAIFDGNESLPYPAKHNDFYSATKAEGEKLVIKANNTNGLLTCCIRPSSLFGPGDMLLVPSLVNAAKAGKSKFIIGDGNNLYDFTYVENVAHAHVCAERALASPEADKAAGQAYFITNMEPIKFWEFISLILEGLGYERPRIKIPATVMMPIAHIVEWTYKMLGPYGMKVPQLTPSRIRLLSQSRTFNCSKANDRLGYAPIVSLQVGIKRTIESYSDLRAVPQIKREGPSKASRLLGGGRVADTLLWRDKKQTLTSILVLVAIYYIFIVPGSTMITILAKLLILAIIFLLIHSFLPEKILGYKVEKVSESHFHVSEEKSQEVALSVASLWNSAVKTLKTLCKGNDWVLFLKVALSLLVLSFLGVVSLQRFFVIGLPLAFVAFFVYERKEQEIDDMFLEVFSVGSKLKSNVAKRFNFKKHD